MNASTQRKLVRVLHLIGAAVIGTYVYSPWKELEWFSLLTQVLIIPALTLSGLWMWQGHKLRSLLNKNKS